MRCNQTHFDESSLAYGIGAVVGDVCHVSVKLLNILRNHNIITVVNSYYTLRIYCTHHVLFVRPIVSDRMSETMCVVNAVSTKRIFSVRLREILISRMIVLYKTVYCAVRFIMIFYRLVPHRALVLIV